MLPDLPPDRRRQVAHRSTQTPVFGSPLAAGA